MVTRVIDHICLNIAEDVEIDVESMVWTLESCGSSHAGVDHSYSTSDHTWF